MVVTHPASIETFSCDFIPWGGLLHVNGNSQVAMGSKPNRGRVSQLTKGLSLDGCYGHLQSKLMGAPDQGLGEFQHLLSVGGWRLCEMEGQKTYHPNWAWWARNMTVQMVARPAVVASCSSIACEVALSGAIFRADNCPWSQETNNLLLTLCKGGVILVRVGPRMGKEWRLWSQ